ncbi:MAG: ATP-binding protein [Desulfobulbaceae bacterium]|nr:ATP-binding protein [Desulfobulbaceae bacterium]
MNNFFNRNNELLELRTCYKNNDHGALVILYGRRRLGKTSLLREFVRDLPHTYFMADRAGEHALMTSLAISMAVSLDEPLLQAVDYPSWYELFSAFDRLRPKDRKFILIFDEYQYFCQVQPAFSSFIQKWWDEHWQHDNIMLILCGSITSMMYRETMTESAPLYGRASLQLLLSPMEYPHVQDFLPGRQESELIEMYSLSGGVPRYLELLQSYDNFADALKGLVLSRSGILFQEARYLLHEEISTPNTCWSILNALGSGVGRISELGSRLKLPANQLTRYIDLLRDLFLVRREVPVLEKNPHTSKKGYYIVADPFLRLWFGSVYPYESFLEFGQTDLIMKRLMSMVNTHITYCFEEMCRTYVRRNYIADCVRVGRQWGKDYEIDVAGVDIENMLCLAGECKWSKKPVGLSVLIDLKSKVKGKKLPVASEWRIVLFSRSGFTHELTKEAVKDGRIILVGSLFDQPHHQAGQIRGPRNLSTQE